LPASFRQAIAGAVLGTPLALEALEVVLELLAAVDAQAGKGAAAEMMHEHVEGHQQAKTGGAGAHAQVINIEEAQAIALIEAADLVEHRPAHEQAKAGEPVHLE